MLMSRMQQNEKGILRDIREFIEVNAVRAEWYKKPTSEKRFEENIKKTIFER